MTMGKNHHIKQLIANQFLNINQRKKKVSNLDTSEAIREGESVGENQSTARQND